jgi:hypothetical protein
MFYGVLRDRLAILDQPDHHWADAWLHRGYLNFWPAPLTRAGQGPDWT